MIQRIIVVVLFITTIFLNPVSGDNGTYARVDLWFGSDKVLHFSVSFGIGLVTYISYTEVFRDNVNAKYVAIGSVLLFALMKEYYDWRTKQMFSYKDLSWDAVGGVTGMFLGEIYHATK